jgi:hypothetical protein
MTRRPGLATLPLAALLLAGCGGGGTDSSNLPLRLTVEPTGTVKPGDTLRMTAYLINPGSRPVRLEFDDQCQVEFYVQSPDKTVLHPPGGGTSCMGGPTAIDLPPGDSVRFTDSWLVASTYVREHTAYAVLWEHHEPTAKEREYEQGHRSNIIPFLVASPAQESGKGQDSLP